jgi:sugar phosphate isomerase/epimerase
MQRRQFLAGALAAASLPGMARAQGLDPQDAGIRFGTTGSVFGSWTKNDQGLYALQMSPDIPTIMRDIRHYGLEGFEPYAAQITQYRDDPLALKRIGSETGVVFVSVGDLPARKGAAPIPAAQLPWLGGPGRAALVAEMEACARDFLQPLGIDHWKNNMGMRPPGGPSDDQLKALADTANEIGRRTIKYGVRLSLHPHLWGPMEREHEFRRVMELTDPALAHLILDTGHNVLGGMDVVKIADEFFPRITEFHLKDTFPQFRGNTATPSQDAHYRGPSVYAAVGQGGGVDFPGVFAVMRRRRFRGWAVFDIDAPRPGDGSGTVDDNLAASVNYLHEKLGVKLPPAKGSDGLYKG